MNDLIDTINTVNNPQQAIQEFVGEQFIEWLLNFISTQIRESSVISKITSIETTQPKIKKFMLQRFLADRALLGTKEGEPGFLRFAIANLSESDDPDAESALEILQTKFNQETENSKHETWINLLHGLGATDEEIAHTEPKETTRNYIAELSEVFSNEEWPLALGAFASFECVEVLEFEAINKILANNTDLKQKGLGFSAKPAAQTNHLLDKVSFDLQTKSLVWEGARHQMQIHEDLLLGLVKYLEN